MKLVDEMMKNNKRKEETLEIENHTVKGRGRNFSMREKRREMTVPPSVQASAVAITASSKGHDAHASQNYHLARFLVFYQHSVYFVFGYLTGQLSIQSPMDLFLHRY